MSSDYMSAEKKNVLITRVWLIISHLKLPHLSLKTCHLFTLSSILIAPILDLGASQQFLITYLEITVPINPQFPTCELLKHGVVSFQHAIDKGIFIRFVHFSCINGCFTCYGQQKFYAGLLTGVYTGFFVLVYKLLFLGSSLRSICACEVSFFFFRRKRQNAQYLTKP